MKCPTCGTESSGKFCPSCGGPLRSAHCAECGAALPPGARFCTKCGAGVAGAARGASARNSNLPWYLAAGVLVLIIAVLVVPMLTGNGNDGFTTTSSPIAPMGGGNGTPPPLTGTPREQADRLFNRIMSAQAQGDTTNARFFTPMAIQAYQSAQPLDHDGLYHLAMVHTVAGDYAAARNTAQQVLAQNPNHPLALAAAGEAAERAGDVDDARAFYRRFLDAYDAEIARGLQEYQDHARIMPELQATAQRVTGN
jgi:predicted nucleic acid-binding Zn ribbon protein